MELAASAAGSPVPDGSLLRATVYPDGDGRSAAIAALNNAEGGNFVETAYNAAGLTATSTDQRGARHTYSYDDLGRLTADAVAAYPASDNFDHTILAITRAYDEQGRLVRVTSHSDAEPDTEDFTDAVNGILWNYDSWGNAAASFRNHAAAADDTDPAVQYAYDWNDDPQVDEAAPYVRLSEIAAWFKTTGRRVTPPSSPRGGGEGLAGGASPR